MNSFRTNRHALESTVFGTLGVMLLVYSLYSHNQVEVAWKLSPYLFPVFIAVLLVIVSVSLFIQGRTHTSDGKQGIQKEELKRVAGFVALVILYYILLPILGFLITDTILLALFVIYLGLRSWWKITAISVGFTVTLYVVFQVLLNVRLPKGILSWI